MRLPISEATPKQLRAFASALGLEASPTMTGATLRALIASAWEHDYIDEPEAEVPAVQEGAFAPVIATGKRVRIIIQNEEFGIDPVPVSVNGRAITIKRGEPVDILPEYVEALRNAKRQIAIQDRNGSIIGMREIPTFPFQIVG